MGSGTPISGVYVGAGSTIPFYVTSDPLDNTFNTVAIGTQLATETGSIFWSDGTVSGVDTVTTMGTDPATSDRVLVVEWTLTSGRFASAVPVEEFGYNSDVVDAATLTVTGASLTFLSITFG